MTTNYEKYFGTPEKAAASLKDIEEAMIAAHRRDDVPGMLAKEVADPMDWIIEEAGLGSPRRGTTHGLFEWMREESGE